ECAVSRPQNPHPQERRAPQREPDRSEPGSAKPKLLELCMPESLCAVPSFLSFFFLILAALVAPSLHAGAKPIDIGNLEVLSLDQADYLVSDQPLSLSEARQRSFGSFGPDVINQGISDRQHW